MFLQSKKVIPWKKRDYINSISLFILHICIIMAIIIGTIFLSADCKTLQFKEYFLNADTRNNFIYIVISVTFIVAIMFLYFFFEFKDFLIRPKNINVVFSIIEFSIIISYITGKYIDVYARPVALCALLILLLVNKRTAIFVNFCFCLMIFIVDVFSNQVFANNGAVYSSLVLGCTCSLLGIYLVDGEGSRIRVFAKGFFISIPVIICTICLEVQTGMHFVKILPYFVWGLMSGVTSVVYMMAIIPVFEYTFNILTNYRLVEITDHKSKLIQKLIKEAGGTFNHSLIVASLAESCASAIGENPLLARAAAYYHDIGKIKQPMYFAENQHGENPHDELTPELSTEIIRSHTKDGYELIKKYHLPLILADVAREHHGTLPIQFFYMKAQKYTDGELNISDYSYPGPKPRTKIAAIIMLADGCEAAVRAQNDRSHERVEKVVRGIIEDRMNNDQFSECEITMNDIDIIRMTIEDSLTGVDHDRINYPKLKVGHKNNFAQTKTKNDTINKKGGKNGQA